MDIVAEGRLLPSFREVFQIGITLLITLIAWVFFRAESIADAIQYIGGMISLSLFSTPELFPQDLLLLILLFVIVEWLQRNKAHALQFDKVQFSRFIRWIIYYVVFIFIYMNFFLFQGNQQEFIYFQF